MLIEPKKISIEKCPTRCLQASHLPTSQVTKTCPSTSDTYRIVELFTELYAV